MISREQELIIKGWIISSLSISAAYKNIFF